MQASKTSVLHPTRIVFLILIDGSTKMHQLPSFSFFKKTSKFFFVKQQSTLCTLPPFLKSFKWNSHKGFVVNIYIISVQTCFVRHAHNTMLFMFKENFVKTVLFFCSVGLAHVSCRVWAAHLNALAVLKPCQTQHSCLALSATIIYQVFPDLFFGLETNKMTQCCIMLYKICAFSTRSRI